MNSYNSVDGMAPVELYKFQVEYLRGLPAKTIMAADTGTGKTFMALAHYDKHAYLKPLLILAPAAKINSGDWERDVKHYFAGRLMPEVRYYSYEKFSRKVKPAEFRKTGSLGVARDYIREHASGFAVIADEVHKAKNPQSGIGQETFRASQSASFFVGLSATPLPNGWIDAANYFKIFGFSKNITKFKERYVIEQKYKGFPEIVGYQLENELKHLWNSVAKPLSKQLALDLPPITTVPVTLGSGVDYIKILRDRRNNIGELLETSSALLHALRRSIIPPKVVWLNDFLEEVSDNVVVFYNYIEEREAILAMINKSHKGRQVFRQDGEKHEVPDKTKWSGLRRTITLAQYQSGSTGIELTYAATTIYFSPTYSYSNYEQSIGRTNRNGQTKKMTLYMLCAPTTIERDVWAALKNKTDFQEKQWFAQQMVDNKPSSVIQS